jgi:Polypeptide deformylase
MFSTTSQPVSQHSIATPVALGFAITLGMTSFAGTCVMWYLSCTVQALYSALYKDCLARVACCCCGAEPACCDVPPLHAMLSNCGPLCCAPAAVLQLQPMYPLSIPHPLAALQRAEEIAVKAQNEVGQDISLSFTGWTARIFQHEFDHLQVRTRGLIRSWTMAWWVEVQSPDRERHPGTPPYRTSAPESTVVCAFTHVLHRGKASLVAMTVEAQRSPSHPWPVAFC